MLPRLLVVLSEEDPVARYVGERWGTGPPAGPSVAGVPVRVLSDHTWTVRRSRLHIQDDALISELPRALQAPETTLVFPSIHFSETGSLCFAVHPLGNLGSSAEVGGEAGRIVPSAPRWMASALRRLSELGEDAGLAATFEATHHGPLVHQPAFFIEVGGGPSSRTPDPAHAHCIAEAIASLEEDAADRIALGVGGGHYVPHLTDLALRRHWAFGHLLPRHALDSLEAAVAADAWNGTRGCEGIVYARAADAERPVLRALGPRLREQDAPLRERPLGGAARTTA